MSAASGGSGAGLAAARSEYEAMRRWFVDEALPLWSTVGVDRVGGGFVEKIDRTGAPSQDARRTRVVGRQLFVFAGAARLGWAGPCEALIAHGLAWFRRACLSPDGTVFSTARPDGTPEKTGFELYDHAFALFGLAAAFAVTGDRDLSAIATTMRKAMKAGWGHPLAGFEAARPRRLPLEANPHMHVFEAASAWAAVLPADEGAPWAALADEIAVLALDHFIDPRSGVLREFYDGDWRPMTGDAGRLVEPGHQFEWAWLLTRWGRLRGDAWAVETAGRLFASGERGLDAGRGVAIDALDETLQARSSSARLWPQTEWLKAALILAEGAQGEARGTLLDSASAALRGLTQYLKPSGLWHDRLGVDGVFDSDPAPASSLYHIVAASRQLRETLGAVPEIAGSSGRTVRGG